MLGKSNPNDWPARIDKAGHCHVVVLMLQPKPYLEALLWTLDFWTEIRLRKENFTSRVEVHDDTSCARRTPVDRLRLLKGGLPKAQSAANCLTYSLLIVRVERKLCTPCLRYVSRYRNGFRAPPALNEIYAHMP